jgi:hypothetical protein
MGPSLSVVDVNWSSVLVLGSRTQCDPRVKAAISAEDVHVSLAVIAFIGFVHLSLCQNN